MKITNNIRITNKRFLSRTTNVRSRRTVTRLHRRIRIITSRSRPRTTITRRHIRSIRSLNPSQRIRHTNKFVHSRSLKIKNRRRHSRSTLTRTTKRLIQMGTRRPLKVTSLRNNRRFRHTNPHNNTPTTYIRAVHLRSLKTSTRSKIRTRLKILRSRTSTPTTSHPRPTFQRIRGKLTIRIRTHNNSTTKKTSRPGSHTTNRQLT